MRLYRFEKFINEDYSPEDVGFSEETISRLKNLTEKGLIKDYWVEVRDEWVTSKEDDLRANPIVLKNALILIVEFSSDQQYAYDQYSEKSLHGQLNILEENSLYIPREDIESIKEIMLLMQDGWAFKLVNENMADYIFEYMINDKSVWLMGLNFRRKDDVLKIVLRSNMSRSGTQFRLEETTTVDNWLKATKKLVAEFYDVCWKQTS